VVKTLQMSRVSARALGRVLTACKTQSRCQPGSQVSVQQVLGGSCAAPVSLCSRSHAPCHTLHLRGPPLLHHLLLLWPLPEEAAAAETLQLPGECRQPPVPFPRPAASPPHSLGCLCHGEGSEAVPGCPPASPGDPQAAVSSWPPSAQMSDQSEGTFNDVERSSVSSTPNSNVSTPSPAPLRPPRLAPPGPDPPPPPGAALRGHCPAGA